MIEKPFNGNHIMIEKPYDDREPPHGKQKRDYDIWSQAYIHVREFGFVRFAHSLRSLRSLCMLASLAIQILYPPRRSCATANPIPLLVSL